jgi:hypothetical protein
MASMYVLELHTIDAHLSVGNPPMTATGHRLQTDKLSLDSLAVVLLNSGWRDQKGS